MAQGNHDAVHRSHSVWGSPRVFVTKGQVAEPVITSEELTKDKLVMHLAILVNRSSVDECKISEDHIQTFYRPFAAGIFFSWPVDTYN